jgi:prolyl-tRNA editing enzyme YbaK/EbsC (Cys-tRNA(Pro) deacylase)
MVAAWPEDVERVAAFLRSSGAEARLEQLHGATATAKDAARAAGCDLPQIVKSLVVLCDGKAVVALVPGDRRADLEKIRRAAGAATGRVARPEEVREATGFAPGAVAPFPLPGVEKILVDRRLLTQPVVWTGGGSETHLVRLEPAELVRLARAEPMDVVEDATYHSQPESDGKEH